MSVFENNWKRLLLGASTVAFAALGTSKLSAATIAVDTLLTNASFESPSSTGVPPTCPTAWTCSGSPAPAGTYTVTTNQYTPGADGLSGGRIVPNGAQAAFSPTYIEGSGDLAQSIAGLTYVAGNTYTLTFWVGRPLTVPGNVNCQGTTTPPGPCSVTGFPQTVQVYFTENGTQDGLPSFTITDPGAGQWVLDTVSFTAAAGQAYIGQTVGVDFHVASTSNQNSVNFDMGSVPEPATMALFGVGLLGIAAWKRRRKA